MASITKIGNKKYRIRISKGTGRGRYAKSYTVRGMTKKEANTFANEKERLLDLGQLESEVTFDEYFKKWLKTIKPTLAPRTYYDYETYIKRYALDPLGKIKMSKIKTHHIQAIYDDMRGRDLSSVTIHTLKSKLSVCFNYALSQEHLTKNPNENCTLPRKESKERTVLNITEVGRFVKACQEKPNGLIFEFALETGMRPRS